LEASEEVTTYLNPPPIAPKSILRAIYCPDYNRKVDVYYKGKNIFNYESTNMSKYAIPFPMNLEIKPRESLVIRILNKYSGTDPVTLCFIFDLLNK